MFAHVRGKEGMRHIEMSDTVERIYRRLAQTEDVVNHIMPALCTAWVLLMAMMFVSMA